MKVRPSKNAHAVVVALDLHRADLEALSATMGVEHCRGVVNARRLGLSLNKPEPKVSKRNPAAKPARRDLRTIMGRTQAYALRHPGVNGFDLHTAGMGYESVLPPPNVRGKDRTLRPAGYARKAARAKRRFLERYLKAHPKADAAQAAKDLAGT